MPKLSVRAALLFAVACCPFDARALVVYDTFALGEIPGVYAPVGQLTNQDFQIAYPFDMPADSGNRPLESITLRLADPTTQGTVPGDYRLRLREDAGGTPGAVLEEWTLTDALPTPTDVTFDSVTQPLLLEGTRYWLNLKAEPDTGVGWWSVANLESLDLLFAHTAVLDPTWLAPTVPYRVGLAEVVVPEPDALWLGTAAVAGLACLRSQRARA